MMIANPLTFFNIGVVTRNAINIFGPGHSTGTGINTSTGAPVNVTLTYKNVSGAPITVASAVLAGWILTTAGTSPCGNDVPITGDIEYPIGVTHNPLSSGGSPGVTVVNNVATESDRNTLITPIPNGATFNLNLSATIAAGLKYITNFGIAGINTTALASTLRKEMLFAVGDSIMTNNGGCVAAVATFLNCPSIQMSISGTTATTYGANSAANFVRQAALAVKLGATRFVSNFGTNDFGSNNTGLTAAQLNAILQNMRSLANSNGILFTQATIMPRTKKANVNITSASASGNIMSVLVPDASIFTAGCPYTIAGFNESQYNGNLGCLSVNTGTNIVTFPCLNTTPSNATGSGTITARLWSCRGFQTPITAQYASGPSSDRAVFNALVRAGAFDSYIDWGDACELTRNDGLWAVGGDKSELPAPQNVTVTSGTPRTATRFQTTFSGPNNVMAGGFADFTSGANIGETHGANSNTGGDYTSGSAFANIPSIGDALYMATGAYPSDDGLHPRTGYNSIGSAGYSGGQALIVNKTISWLNSLL